MYDSVSFDADVFLHFALFSFIGNIIFSDDYVTIVYVWIVFFVQF